MSKPTPGPWTVIPPGHGSETEYLCVQIGGDDSYTTLEMLPADARLIAAAPDLLTAAETALGILEKCHEGWPPTTDELTSPILLLFAALKKARGEEE